MALTSVSEPSDYDIAYRPCEWEVETSVVELDAVKFSLYDNVTASLIKQLTVLPKFGDSDNFKADMGSFIQDYLQADIDVITPNQTAFNSALQIRDFYVTATEQIIVSGSLTNGDTYTSSGVYIVNGCLEVGDDDYVTAGYFTTTSGTKILTDKPRFTTRDGESEYICLYNNEENIKATIITTDSSGVTATGIVNSISLGNKTCYLGIGWENINAYTLNTGSQPLVDADTASYTIQFETVTTGTMFELITVTVDHDYRDESTRFAFMNNYGAIDFVTLWGSKESSIKVDTSISQRTVNDYTDVESYGRFRPNTSQDTLFRVGSQSLPRDEISWLRQLVSSAGVWVQEGTKYRPIVVTTDEMTEYSTIMSNKVFDLTIEYEHANALRRQKG